MDIKFLTRITDISAAQWNGLFKTDYPFIQHAFLNALESSGCTQKTTGWEPQHLLVFEHDVLVAAMPCYLKTHSYGEYVFDWAWANAYQQHGLNYYPKLLCAIPFTPATGARLAFNNDIKTDSEKTNIIKTIDQAIREKSRLHELSGWHVLFPNDKLSDLLTQANWSKRIGIQYHWFNDNYESFEHFLTTFKSRKRKAIRKERQAIVNQEITIQTFMGREISHQMMNDFYRFYHFTYLKRSGQQGYLNLAFFHQLLDTMPEQLVMFCAMKDKQLIGAALCFKDNSTLYGRYWGCEQEYEFLHFEACYYQGIAFCIEHQLQRFDPGAQGEHKIPRGFKPIKTTSNHVILQPDFKQAIDHFIEDESMQVHRDMEYLKTLLPFKSTGQ